MLKLFLAFYTDSSRLIHARRVALVTTGSNESSLLTRTKVQEMQKPGGGVALLLLGVTIWWSKF